MFKLIAIVYLLMNGQPVGDPMRMPSNVTFADIEKCKVMLDSEKNKTALDDLRAKITAQLPDGVSMTLTNECEPAKDDGSI